eukprot:11221358-Lingulodinium_polyedra.AAC.1
MSEGCANVAWSRPAPGPLCGRDFWFRFRPLPAAGKGTVLGGGPPRPGPMAGPAAVRGARGGGGPGGGVGVDLAE